MRIFTFNMAICINCMAFLFLACSDSDQKEQMDQLADELVGGYHRPDPGMATDSIRMVWCQRLTESDSEESWLEPVKVSHGWAVKATTLDGYYTNQVDTWGPSLYKLDEVKTIYYKAVDQKLYCCIYDHSAKEYGAFPIVYSSPDEFVGLQKDFPWHYYWKVCGAEWHISDVWPVAEKPWEKEDVCAVFYSAVPDYYSRPEYWLEKGSLAFIYKPVTIQLEAEKKINWFNSEEEYKAFIGKKDDYHYMLIDQFPDFPDYN